MTRGRQVLGLEVADAESLAVGEEVVELRAVAPEAALGVVDLGEGVLDRGDPLADADPAAEHVAQVGRRRQVVGMHVRLEDPGEAQGRWPRICAIIASAWPVAVRPDSMSKSSTLSITAQVRVAGSATT